MAGPKGVMVDPLTARAPKTFFKQRWLQGVMRVSHAIGNVMAWVILSVFYVLVITPYGLVFRLLRHDPLRVRPQRVAWQPLASQYDDLEEAKGQ